MTVAGSNAASAYRSYGAKRLAEYLRAERERIGSDLYVNGDRLADELGHPPAEIERHLRELSGSAPGLEISLDSGSPRALWRVSQR
ncbi:MAG: hypothetical protein ACI9TI_001728 [Natronomonas sp.]|jgi:hypothetical protein|uniref:hypothetical protein n=1 Tax=Natronomonas sp. TaxID=2184060 RepID=UPI00398A25CF